MEGSLSHQSVLFLRSRGRAIVRGAAGALAESVTGHDLLVDGVQQQLVRFAAGSDANELVDRRPVPAQW